MVVRVGGCGCVSAFGFACWRVRAFGCVRVGVLVPLGVCLLVCWCVSVFEC